MLMPPRKAHSIISASTMLTGQTLRPGGLTFDRDYSCVSGSRGVDRVYVAQAQPNQRLTVMVTPTPKAMDSPALPAVCAMLCSRMLPSRMRSWDHRKLGMPDMPISGSTAQYLNQ